MTKEIELTRSMVALVDDEDYGALNQYKWYARKHRNTFYASRNIRLDSGKQTGVQMHRQILGLSVGDGKQVDHKNRDGTDNRRSNLWLTSISVNSQNHVLYSTNTSGYCGVSWCTRSGKWVVWIDANNETHFLGYHSDIECAAEARRQGELKHWGEVRSP